MEYGGDEDPPQAIIPCPVQRQPLPQLDAAGKLESFSRSEFLKKKFHPAPSSSSLPPKPQCPPASISSGLAHAEEWEETHGLRVFNSICQLPKSLPGPGAGPQLWLEYPVVSQSPNTTLECHSHSSAAFSLSSPSSQERLQPSDCQQSAESVPQIPQPSLSSVLSILSPSRERCSPHHTAWQDIRGLGAPFIPAPTPGSRARAPGTAGAAGGSIRPWGHPAARPGAEAHGAGAGPSGQWDTRLGVARGWQGGWHSWHNPPGTVLRLLRHRGRDSNFHLVAAPSATSPVQTDPAAPVAPSNPQQHWAILSSPQPRTSRLPAG